MKYVKQEDKFGCTVACMAMILDKTYQDIAYNFPAVNEKQGLCSMHYESFLFEHGYICYTLYPTIGWSQKKRENWPVEPFAPIHIVSVITNVNTSHAVIMDEVGRVYDPYKEGVFSLNDFSKINSITGFWKK